MQREPNIEILFEASNGSDLIHQLKTTAILPDIILMDLKMPILNGVEATKIIHKDFPQIRIIALTSYNTKSFIANMIDVGAASYLVKSSTPKAMLKTINEVAEKGFYYNETVMEVIHQDILSKNSSRTLLDDDFLTIREKEVLIEKAKKEVLILENKRLLEIGKLACKHGLHDYEDTLLDQHFSKLSKELSHGNSTEN